jgi:hypothetical protein
MAEAHVAAAYATLGLGPGSTDRDVKEAYRRLVLQHHPDRAPLAQRAASEQTFLRVRAAYDLLLRRSAGYAPPPPNSPPSAAYAEAWWHAHSSDGRVPWGKYNGYESEGAFYRAMVKSGRSSLLWLSAAGLLGVPVITGLSMAAQSLRNGGGGSKHRRRDASREARGWGMTAGGLLAAAEEEEEEAKAAAAGAAGGAATATETAAARENARALLQEDEGEEEDDDAGLAVLGLDALREGHRVNGGVALSSPFAATTALDRHAFFLREREREMREREAREKETEGGVVGKEGAGKEGRRGAGGPKAAAAAPAAAR